ncbi:hypothetical protein GLOIN_2v1595057 [Rhizophagus irregularis DAOM 181602=DAOM 197198]|uniref:Uncharacterized protein n=1 Tax=Rhizophagus irregularis (strain DAOM 181602 / DAOM 197198 / MUCL 43194) TaxID=747089 RepID=A0A2P4Q479_RHIID|nr:hypothetical protein GLOIN_2v1595057 [Rhizophagus irregularis DAOM 181602=DAOM 197198]POG72426.1 hypothetical protein GLOIN_2v1595057 [Rhizophagus irregularis DAOM 181602=DAOM 197198]|eukprot:XP_025179292.1 hypothetical protein GLOIN_2v1595057 [Rhizophagus irregularis DAOM 181602=DAOM 197198]
MVLIYANTAVIFQCLLPKPFNPLNSSPFQYSKKFLSILYYICVCCHCCYNSIGS